MVCVLLGLALTCEAYSNGYLVVKVEHASLVLSCYFWPQSCYLLDFVIFVFV